MAVRLVRIVGVIFASTVLWGVAAASASAAIIELSPASASTAAGQTVSVQVIVDTQGSRAVSGQFELSYPVDMLTPVSFTFAPGWIETLDGGTDSSSGGTIVKAGGYAAGFYGTKVMGTLVFTALRAGAATIAIQDKNSYVFGADSGNLFTGPLSSARIDIAPGATPPAAAVATAAVSPQTASTTSAAVGSGISWPWVLLLVLMLALVALYLFRIRKKKNKRRRW